MPALAEPLRVAVPDQLAETGLIDHVAPRYSLKYGVRIEQVNGNAPADLVLGETGQAVFEGQTQVWHIRSVEDHPDGPAFVDWLLSETGRKTVTSYAPGGDPLFTGPPTISAGPADRGFEGDALLGLDISRVHCARCHAVEEAGRLNAIGSSPSFMVLRTLDDWPQRFETFYVLNPHPAFTQIADVTPPFPIDRPSPIAPVDMTLEDLDAILAYVADLPAADLGAPLQHQ
ncbi:hypothetical protein jaqu_25930 [Jannaschia aquimarina]|uniref:Cytochrome c domain-containing protein n=2 Tax=Jannaschia aquimarina TaxID=935700 RepID=A0A0D1EFQ4_9RHOB|nr:hypothetical protein jaqu_25930 [Jannaschia aquimarina]SNT38758.1 hypothetical protein SAMN05421775_11411 [Jannaschia aquimarina]